MKPQENLKVVRFFRYRDLRRYKID